MTRKRGGNRPRVTINPVADGYHMTGERIIEFSSDSGGGLISLRERDGRLYVEVYRADPGVVVKFGYDEIRPPRRACLSAPTPDVGGP